MLVREKDVHSEKYYKILNIIKVDKDSPMPLYRQLVNYFEDLLDKNMFKPHEKLPSELILSRYLGLSRMTVRKSFELLEQLGLIYRRNSKGTFVAPKKIEQSPTLLIGFAKKMEVQGYRPFTVVKSKKITHPLRYIQKLLKIGLLDNVYEIIRVRGIKPNETLVLQKTYIPVKLFPNLCKEDLTKSLTDIIIHKYRYELKTYWATIEPIIPSEEEIKFLRLDKNNPCLLIKGITSSIQGVPLRYSFGIYRSDKLNITIKEELLNIYLRK